jgi:hypothetical protein
LGDPANNDKAVVFWSRADARSRANAACLVACYMVLIQAWPPHLALAPIAQADPPYMPFRDAGYSQADFILNIQDVVYGVWKAKEENLCQLKEFNLEEYVSIRHNKECLLTALLDTSDLSALTKETSTGFRPNLLHLHHLSQSPSHLSRCHHQPTPLYHPASQR